MIIFAKAFPWTFLVHERHVSSYIITDMIMKKVLISLVLACAAMPLWAQEPDPTLKNNVVTNSFWSNWFFQVGADWNAWYSNEESSLHFSKSPFKKFRSNPGISIALGKWFTPGLGLRTKVQGIWGKTVTDENNDGNGNKYWILNEQALFNLSNMIGGYNPDRVWSIIPFAGAGFGRTCTYNLYAMQLSVGLLNEFRLCRKLALNVEVGWNRCEGDIDGVTSGIHQTRGWKSHDNNLYGEVGLTFNIGHSSWDRVPDVDAIKAMSQAELDALNAQLSDANAENERLKGLLEKESPDASKTVKEYVTAPVSVFFNLNEDRKMADPRDLEDVKGLVEYAKNNNAHLLVTGYADNATGNEAINKKLAEGRANTVADQLVRFGLSRDQIKVVSKGGVNDLSPVSYNRRATVEVTE